MPMNHRGSSNDFVQRRPSRTTLIPWPPNVEPGGPGPSWSPGSGLVLVRVVGQACPPAHRRSVGPVGPFRRFACQGRFRAKCGPSAASNNTPKARANLFVRGHRRFGQVGAWRPLAVATLACVLGVVVAASAWRWQWLRQRAGRGEPARQRADLERLAPAVSALMAVTSHPAPPSWRGACKCAPERCRPPTPGTRPCSRDTRPIQSARRSPSRLARAGPNGTWW